MWIIGMNNPKCVTAAVWAGSGIFIVSNSKFYVSASLSTSLQFILHKSIHIYVHSSSDDKDSIVKRSFIHRLLSWVQCSMFNVQCLMFNIQCSMFNVQCSMFDVQC